MGGKPKTKSRLVMRSRLERFGFVNPVFIGDPDPDAPDAADDAVPRYRSGCITHLLPSGQTSDHQPGEGHQYSPRLLSVWPRCPTG